MNVSTNENSQLSADYNSTDRASMINPNFNWVRVGLSCWFMILSVASVNAQSFTSRADKYVRGYAEKGQFMGAVLVARNGKVIFEKGYGMADLAWDVPVTPQTKFNIGSLTKQFTGLAHREIVESKMARPVVHT